MSDETQARLSSPSHARPNQHEPEETTIGFMKDLKYILATVLMLGALSTSALARESSDDQKPPPPKNEKQVPKAEKKDPPPPPSRNGGNKGDKRGRP